MLGIQTTIKTGAQTRRHAALSGDVTCAYRCRQAWPRWLAPTGELHRSGATAFSFSLIRTSSRRAPWLTSPHIRRI